MQKIVPHLWYNDNAEAAVRYYLSVFPGGKILNISRYGDSGASVSGRPAGTVMTISFELEGQQFIALNGGPVFTFSPAISFLVNCETQEEIDRLWERLSDGGEQEQCGWLRDKFGVTWQITPSFMGSLFEDGDPARIERVMKVMLTMNKLDIAALKKAYDG